MGHDTWSLGIDWKLTVCHFDPFSGFMLMEKLLCGTLPAHRIEKRTLPVLLLKASAQKCHTSF